jgi:hypothetical protein
MHSIMNFRNVIVRVKAERGWREEGKRVGGREGKE